MENLSLPVLFLNEKIPLYPEVTATLLSKKGNTLITGNSYGQVAVWKIENKLLTQLSVVSFTHRTRVIEIVEIPDPSNTLFASISTDGYVNLFHSYDGFTFCKKQVFQCNPKRVKVFYAMSRLCLLGCGTTNYIEIVDLKTLTVIYQSYAHGSWIVDMAILQPLKGPSNNKSKYLKQNQAEMLLSLGSDSELILSQLPSTIFETNTKTNISRNTNTNTNTNTRTKAKIRIKSKSKTNINTDTGTGTGTGTNQKRPYQQPEIYNKKKLGLGLHPVVLSVSQNNRRFVVGCLDRIYIFDRTMTQLTDPIFLPEKYQLIQIEFIKDHHLLVSTSSEKIFLISIPHKDENVNGNKNGNGNENKVQNRKSKENDFFNVPINTSNDVLLFCILETQKIFLSSLFNFQKFHKKKKLYARKKKKNKKNKDPIIILVGLDSSSNLNFNIWTLDQIRKELQKNFGNQKTPLILKTNEREREKVLFFNDKNLKNIPKIIPFCSSFSTLNFLPTIQAIPSVNDENHDNYDSKSKKINSQKKKEQEKKRKKRNIKNRKKNNLDSNLITCRLIYKNENGLPEKIITGHNSGNISIIDITNNEDNGSRKKRQRKKPVRITKKKKNLRNFIGGHKTTVTCLFIPKTDLKKKYLFSGGLDCFVCIWDLGKCILLKRFYSHVEPIISFFQPPEGRFREYILSVSNTNISVIDVATLSEFAIYSGHSGQITDIYWKRTNDYFFSKTINNMLYVWNLSSGDLENIVSDKISNEILKFDNIQNEDSLNSKSNNNGNSTSTGTSNKSRFRHRSKSKNSIEIIDTEDFDIIENDFENDFNSSSFNGNDGFDNNPNPNKNTDNFQIIDKWDSNHRPVKHFIINPKEYNWEKKDFLTRYIKVTTIGLPSNFRYQQIPTIILDMNKYLNQLDFEEKKILELLSFWFPWRMSKAIDKIGLSIGFKELLHKGMIQGSIDNFGSLIISLNRSINDININNGNVGKVRGREKGGRGEKGKVQKREKEENLKPLWMASTTITSQYSLILISLSFALQDSSIPKFLELGISLIEKYTQLISKQTFRLSLNEIVKFWYRPTEPLIEKAARFLFTTVIERMEVKLLNKEIKILTQTLLKSNIQYSHHISTFTLALIFISKKSLIDKTILKTLLNKLLSMLSFQNDKITTHFASYILCKGFNLFKQYLNNKLLLINSIFLVESKLNPNFNIKTTAINNDNNDHVKNCSNDDDINIISEPLYFIWQQDPINFVKKIIKIVKHPYNKDFIKFNAINLLTNCFSKSPKILFSNLIDICQFISKIFINQNINEIIKSYSLNLLSKLTSFPQIELNSDYFAFGNNVGELLYLNIKKNQLKNIVAHNKKINLVQFSPSGKFLATLSIKENILKIWKFKSKKPIKIKKKIKCTKKFTTRIDQKYSQNRKMIKKIKLQWEKNKFIILICDEENFKFKL
ncbi:rabconnectin-3b [Anaeramoeba flamelloides]|uniref:Rabconnectin-3b n=1 Tax=Anaeramoeba flamelloides TaxID=1746091 RepID=A0ABQ8XYT2_9EUKA|nr:rabconnectin-3b [Anaeramoeba flamelloides]